MKSPQELELMLNEFLGQNLQDARRKLKLGADLSQERKLLVRRLLDNADRMCDDGALRVYWGQLYSIYSRIDSALTVTDETELRKFAAKVVFSGEEENADND